MAIIGGGIGGLAAAVALRRVSVESIVLEQVTEIREVGAGLSIWPNAVNALRELGLEAAVTASASVVEYSLAQTPSGRLIARTELSPFTREAGVPCLCIHRAILQKLLLDALPPASVITALAAQASMIRQ